MRHEVECAKALIADCQSCSQRLADFHKSYIPEEELIRLLEGLLKHKMIIASVIRTHIRNVKRLLNWAAGKGYNIQGLSAPQLAFFLIDEGRGGHTVSRSLLLSVTWFEHFAICGWPVEDKQFF